MIEFHKVLTFFKQYQYIAFKNSAYHNDIFSDIKPDDLVLRRWDTKTKLLIQGEMIKNKIIKPVKGKTQTENDQLANFRNHINLCRKLGFAYVNKLEHLYITDMGETFLSASNLEAMKIVLEKQLRRLQFFNPSINLDNKNTNQDYKEFNIFPYFYVLSLLLSLEEQYLTIDEYVLFVSFAKTEKDLPKSKKMINAFRSLDAEVQQKVIKEATIAQPHKIQGSVTLGIFGLTTLLHFESGKLTLTDKAKAAQQLKKVFSGLQFVEYASFEDWFYYMGSIEEEIKNEAVLDYYVTVGKQEKAKEIVALEDDLEKKASLAEKLYKLFKEKHLEDELEQNIKLLGEQGLKIISEGRQYKTDVSYIDLLCKDADGYVVVELKRGRTEDEAVGQVLRYMGWVRDNLSVDKTVRGLIVVAFEGVTEKLRKAVRGVQREDNLIKIIPVNVENGKVQQVQ